jgi:PAS domain S-box-containing protein
VSDTDSKSDSATNREDQETDYRSLVQASPEPVFIHCEGKTVFANPAAVTFLGAESVNQILGTDPIDFVHPDDQEHIRRRRQELQQGSEQLMPTELRYRRLDGGVVLVETVSTRMRWRGRDANLVMMRDLSERDRVQKALKESEQRFRDFAASGSDWMWETDQDHRIAWVSDILRDRYDLAKEALIGEVFWETGKIDVGADDLMHALKSQLPFRGIPFSRLDKDGQRLYRTVNGHPVLDDAGVFRGFRGTTTDATADMEARLQADKSQAQFAEAIENMNDSLAVYDSDDRLVICNGEFRRFSKVPDDFLQPGTTFEAFLRARAKTGMYDHFAEGPVEISIEDWVVDRMARHRDPKGTVHTLFVNERWRRIREERLPGGGTVLIGTDVTDEIQANLALQDSEAQIRLVTDNIPALVAYIDMDQRLRFVNKPYADFFGGTPERLIGKSLREMRGEEAYQNALPNIERVLAGEATTVEEVRQFQDGKSADWRVTRIPHFGDDGEILGYFVIIFDITDDRRREMQLRQSQRMEVVGQLTGGVAHEFNNLLMVVLGNLELIEDGFGDEESRRRLLEAAKKAAIRGGDLTQRLLAFSRRQDLRAKSIDLNELVEGLVDMSRRTLGESVTVVVESAVDLWSVVADEGQVEAALLNFQINARDAMPNGGKLTIRTANAVIGAGDIPAGADARPGEYVLLEVSDTGHGMEPEVIERAFEPFFTTKKIGEGTGLGLSMAYGFAEQSGGFLAIESEIGRGTSLRLYLPRAEIVAKDHVSTDEAMTVEPGTGTILVVEDDSDVRDLVVHMLRELEYRVLEAEDGPDALSVLENSAQIDILFTDVVLPGDMNGTEIARRALAKLPDLKVMLTTGYAENTLGDLTLGGAISGIIRKPYRKGELAEALARLTRA